MGDPTTLFGIAAIITSVLTGATGLIAVLRGSKSERKRAAQGAIDRVLGDDDEEDDDERREAVKRLLERLLEQQDEGGES